MSLPMSHFAQFQLPLEEGFLSHIPEALYAYLMQILAALITLSEHGT